MNSQRLREASQLITQKYKEILPTIMNKYENLEKNGFISGKCNLYLKK
jgi:hypothetical protein